MKEIASVFCVFVTLWVGIQCDSVEPETRIIGGSVVDIAAHPYLVSIRYRDSADAPYIHQCAGVIYNERCVITSAQCVLIIPANDRIMIVAGANKRVATEGLPYQVQSWISHPEFSYTTVDNDIGLIILAEPFNLENFRVSTISIADRRPTTGRYATVAGWGYREEYGPSSTHLEDTRVPIVSTEDCTAAYGEGEITDRMICAGFLVNGGRDACHGDTGGPLVVDGQLVGLVSWGRGCARPGYPGVYTFVPSLKDWVDQTYAAEVERL